MYISETASVHLGLSQVLISYHIYVYIYIYKYIYMYIYINIYYFIIIKMFTISHYNKYVYSLKLDNYKC